MIAEAYRGGKHDPFLRHLVKDAHLTVNEHRNLCWICAVGRKP